MVTSDCEILLMLPCPHLPVLAFVVYIPCCWKNILYTILITEVLMANQGILNRCSSEFVNDRPRQETHILIYASSWRSVYTHFFAVHLK